ncbi:MAG: aspartate aminotransferase family protein [Planctomycetota bacterium]
MAGKSFSMKPKDVPKVDTPFRKIVTKIPAPESIPILEKLRTYEPVSMSGQPLVVWDRAEGVQVYDKWGNMWLDWSSGVLVTNCGHSRAEVREAIINQVDHGLLHSYCFPNEPRALLAEKLVSISPDPLAKAFILTTGAETTENAIKLARTYGVTTGGKKKIGIVTFEHAFHGRTLGAQLAGGIPALKEWIVNLDPAFYQVPFPDGFRCEDTSFDLFEKSLADQGVDPDSIAGVMTETYQGGGASFAPPKYIQALAKWCRKHGALLIMDEVQAGFGRTGKMFGFEHYGIVPDLVCFGKGISSSLPVSAVIGRADVMNQYGPGEMTSTHTGNPVCAAAALANIKLIEKEGLVENARKAGEVLLRELGKIKEKHSDIIGACHGLGLVAGLHMVKPGGKTPDGDLAFRVVERSVEKGLLFFSPVGFGGGTVKIAPPLTITEEAVLDGICALTEAIEEVRP